MVARGGIFAILVGTAVVGGMGLVARMRLRGRKNPAGLADANLSPDERRDAIADYQRRREDEQAHGG